MIRSLLASIVFMGLGVGTALGQQDALGIPGPIMFEDVPFELVWTSHPADTYFKQEYLPDGEELEAYGQMFMVDVLLNGTTVKSAARTMIDSLEQRRASDAVVNYDLIQNDATGELILDFLMSDDSSGTAIVEWNAYRYVPLEGGLALFAISRRGYDEDVDAFLTDLADWRQAAIAALAHMEIPEIVVAD